jgi:hypothetical protein
VFNPVTEPTNISKTQLAVLAVQKKSQQAQLKEAKDTMSVMKNVGISIHTIIKLR